LGFLGDELVKVYMEGSYKTMPLAKETRLYILSSKVKRPKINRKYF